MASGSTSYAASGSSPASPGSRYIESPTGSGSRGVDPFANPSTSWYRPTSPTSSTVSGGSPRSFYSAAQASTSEAGHRTQHWHARPNLQQTASKDLSLFEDDIGDVTITREDHETPQRPIIHDRKGKARQSSDDYSEHGQLYSRSMDVEEGSDDDTETPEDSQRIEEVGC